MSWFETEPLHSLRLIAASGINRKNAVIDVGGGASLLVDRLLADGFTDLSVLDIATTGIDVARRRLGPLSDTVTWIVEDVTKWEPQARYHLWHDRAVFHFLTSDSDRKGYLAAMNAAVAPGGFVILAPFGLAGPEQCSGLPVTRYSAETLATTLGSHFQLLHASEDFHLTPEGVRQHFVWRLFQKSIA